MKNFLEYIKEKLNRELKPKKFLLIDNSYLHVKHKSFDPNRFHLKLVIESKYLKNMKTIDANRIIHSILAEELKNKIHALQIEIK